MKTITRKDFLKLTKNVLSALGLGAILTPIVAYFYPAELEEMPSEPVPAGNVEEIPLWEAKTLRFGRYPAIVVNTETGLKAYSAVCTHFACITKWDPELKQLVCPCHEGYFDPENGEVIAGPPPAPLEALEVEVKDDVIYVSSGGEA